MADFLLFFPYLRLTLFALTIFITLIYAIPIICFRQFHHRNYILTLNICIANFLSAIYWFVFYLMYQLDSWNVTLFIINNCRFAAILPVFLTLQVPFSFVTTSINRFCAIVYYHRPLFRTKIWLVTNIFTQWISCIFFILPLFIGVGPICSNIRWHEIYKFIILVILPTLIFVLTNIRIIIEVRASSRRIQPLRSNSSENRNVRDTTQYSRRDLRLLRHMIILLVIFISGSGPLFIYLCVTGGPTVESIEMASLAILSQLSVLCGIVDLFLYNQELQLFFKKLFLR